MARMDLVLIDTCIWAPFFNRSQSPEKKALDELLDGDRAALTGPILAEVLQGFRRDEQADWVASVLRGMHWLELNWDDWRFAAILGRRLASQGHILPLSDLTISAIALSRSLEVWTIDPHFDLLPKLKRFRVPKE